nr:MAG TPA: hypothetical protein [Caudoviricetes sp.]
MFEVEGCAFAQYPRQACRFRIASLCSYGSPWLPRFRVSFSLH